MSGEVAYLGPQHLFAQGGRRAVFLDRDGVINRWRSDHVKCWREFEFRPGALAFLTAVRAEGWPVVVVTNQSAVGRGLTSASEVAAIHSRLLDAADGAVEAILWCPHTPSDGCECRKPRPGLVRRAATSLGLNLASSYFLGDSLSDMGAAEAAGCQGVLLRDLATGGSCPDEQSSALTGTYQEVSSFEAFVTLIRGTWP